MRPVLMQGIPKYEDAMNGALLQPMNIIQETLNDIDHLSNSDDNDEEEAAVSI